jgi:hypothetical protein
MSLSRRAPLPPKTMRTFRTARLSSKQQQQAGLDGASGGGQATIAAGLDEETRKVNPGRGRRALGGPGDERRQGPYVLRLGQ